MECFQSKKQIKKASSGYSLYYPGWQFIFPEYLGWRKSSTNNILPKAQFLQKIKIFYWQNKFFMYIYSNKETMKFNSAYFYGYYFYFNSKSRD